MKTNRKLMRCAAALTAAVALGACASMQMPALKKSGDRVVVVPKLVIDSQNVMDNLNYQMEVYLEETRTQKSEFLNIDSFRQDYSYFRNIPPGK